MNSNNIKEMRRIAQERLDRAEALWAEGLRLQRKWLEHKDYEDGGASVEAFKASQALRAEGRTLMEAARLLEREPERPAAEEETPAEETPKWSLEQRRAHADLWGMGHWVND